MKAKEYNLLIQCIENGVDHGMLRTEHMLRAYKYDDKPSNEQIKQTIVDSVLFEICEWFNFDEGVKDE
jgi:hypothetical protein